MKSVPFSVFAPVFLIPFLFAPPAHRARTEPAPPSLPRHACAIHPEVDEWARSLEARDLVRDEVFLDVLRSVLDRSAFAEADKADAFYLMLKTIRWNFSGAVQIPPGMDYPALFDGISRTHLAYQAHLQDLRYDVAPLLRIAASEHRTNVVRASHALLLAAILDRKATSATVRSLLAPEEIQRAQAPDILLHHAALATVLVRQPSRAAQLDALWETTPSEEGREDILCVLGIYRDTGRIRARLAEEQDPAHDLTLETGLLLLKRSLSAEAFAAAAAEIQSARPALARALNDLRTRDFQSSTRMSSAFWKTWDGFDLTLYDDGMRIHRGDSFGDFIANPGPKPAP